MAEMRGTSLDNSSPDSAVRKDNVMNSLPVLPRLHQLHLLIYMFITSSDVQSSYEGGGSWLWGEFMWNLGDKLTVSTDFAELLEKFDW